MLNKNKTFNNRDLAILLNHIITNTTDIYLILANGISFEICL